MTYRLVLGVDPGQTGAIVAIADGEFAGVIDMPTTARKTQRKTGGFQVNAALLASHLRALLRNHSGAYVVAAIESVSAMPGNGGSSMFRFGQSDGIVRGVLGALGIGVIEVGATKWKAHHGLSKSEKDASRTVAMQRLPAASEHLTRKKDVGRSDALLIALWACASGQVAGAA